MNETERGWLISGIQQIGVGVPDVRAAFAWHRKTFGMDVPIFSDEGEAALMLPYTGGKPQSRHAILAANLSGGSAFEIWQYTSRATASPHFPIALGDLGIFAARVKAREIGAAAATMKAAGGHLLSEVSRDPRGGEHFFLQDPLGLCYDVVLGEDWFQPGRAGRLTGGAEGCLIGVSDIDRSRALYSDILGYDTVIYDATGVFADFAHLPGGEGRFHRLLLAHSKPRVGAFSRLLGSSRIELVQALSRTPRKIFEDRLWGDLGFIHLCFDVRGMAALQRECVARGFRITADSASSFDMGDAAGRFCYIEDPDGTLIEFVETHRLPILKKLGLYLDLRKRDPKKPLPSWMIRALGLGRVKD